MLYAYRESEFKDLIVDLIDSLISFFKKIEEDGTYYLKHYSFKSIWEDMVKEYLDGNFDKFINGELYLTSNVKKVIFEKSIFYPNSLNVNHFFQPDYYFLDQRGNQIVFDAKYYSKIKGMNYKQICYNLFLDSYIGKEYPDKVINGARYPKIVTDGLGHNPLSNDSYYYFIDSQRKINKITPKYKNIFSALILPSEIRHRKKHFNLSSIYSEDSPSMFISEEYFNIKEVMNYYVDNSYVITND